MPSHEDLPSVAVLRERRAAVAEVLAGTYRDDPPGPRPVLAAVGRFTAEDVADQITGALRGAFTVPEGDDR